MQQFGDGASLAVVRSTWVRLVSRKSNFVAESLSLTLSLGIRLTITGQVAHEDRPSPSQSLACASQ